ncbi:MAG: exodeoxyribonuclease III [Alphaproteobacteria bacterium]|nr:exodeoxyribonuclease III [Alphaproteobacteria bacterium]
MIIATFNVNSVRAHIQNILDWIDEFSPDVILMQEIKCETDVFPYMEFEDKGYNVKAFGQKSYNGVAILSRFSIEDVTTGLPTFPSDTSARYIEAVIDGHIRIASVYAPNGNPVPSEKFEYKKEWMEHFIEHIKSLMNNDEELIIGGDFNVALTDREIYNPKAFEDDAITQPESREGMKKLFDLGLIDSYRIFNPDNDKAYSYFGYRGGCFQKGYGILLDYFLINEKAKSIITNAGIDTSPRGREKPSDHTPLWIEVKG